MAPRHCRDTCTKCVDVASAFTEVQSTVGSQIQLEVQGEVTDNGNGTHQVRFRLRSAGEHRLFAVVNGERVHEAGLRVEAAHGPLTAADVRARVDGADGKGPLSAACGSSSVIIIEVHHKYSLVPALPTFAFPW